MRPHAGACRVVPHSGQPPDHTILRGGGMYEQPFAPAGGRDTARNRGRPGRAGPPGGTGPRRGGGVHPPEAGLSRPPEAGAAAGRAGDAPGRGPLKLQQPEAFRFGLCGFSGKQKTVPRPGHGLLNQASGWALGSSALAAGAAAAGLAAAPAGLAAGRGAGLAAVPAGLAAGRGAGLGSGVVRV